MIFESWPWRNDLVRDAEMLRRWIDRPFGARRDFIVEKKIFTTAYVMRKLADSQKLTTDIMTSDVACRVYACLKRPTVRDRWEWYDHYDIENPVDATVSPKDLFNLIIHSMIFTEFVDENNISNSFLVTTDLRRERGLWEVSFAAYIDLIARIANDNPSLIMEHYDNQKKEWVSWRGHEIPPAAT